MSDTITLQELRKRFGGLMTTEQCEAARAWLNKELEPLFGNLQNCRARNLRPGPIRAAIEAYKTMKWDVSHLNSRIIREAEERQLVH